MQIDRDPTYEKRFAEVDNVASQQISGALTRLTELELGFASRSTIHQETLNYLSVTFLNRRVPDGEIYRRLAQDAVDTLGVGEDAFTIHDEDPDRAPYVTYRSEAGLDPEVVDFMVDSIEAHASEQVASL